MTDPINPLAPVGDDDLRAIVREAIARRAGGWTGAGPTIAPTPLDSADHRQFASHRLFPLLRGGDGDGACLIEPTVRCNHCGYCLSYGH